MLASEGRSSRVMVRMQERRASRRSGRRRYRPCQRGNILGVTFIQDRPGSLGGLSFPPVLLLGGTRRTDRRHT
jgi:hypothetical protein